MANTTETTASSVTLTVTDGLAHIEQGTPLTRLHFFDGKFLIADALTLEQDYHRSLVRMSNLAGGWGVVHGLGIDLAGDQLTVSPGLAITPAGNTVLAGQGFTTPVGNLLKVAAPVPASGNAAFRDCVDDVKAGGTESVGAGIYEITVGPTEGLCGNEAVYGKLCEDACVTDSQRPYWREGLVLRLRPITLKLPDSSAVALTNVHQRNRVASAYFACEPWLTSSLLSANGLAGHVWCNPAQLYGRDEVPIGLLVREGASTRLIDAWSARRERMDSQARGYWQGRMAMRPWNVFLAQILQFQCQLASLFEDKTEVAIKQPDNCDTLRGVLDTTRKELEALHKKYSDSTLKILEKLVSKPVKQDAQSVADEMKAAYADLFDLSAQLSALDMGKVALPRNRLLLNAGFVQLPPAGYLPVTPGRADVAEQLQRMFGEGVRLHYRAARPDVLPHLVEEAQHMERISLTRGLDNPKDLEDVEIFVPDGEIADAAAKPAGTWWKARLAPNFKMALRFVESSSEIQQPEVVSGTTAEPASGATAEAAPGTIAEAAKPDKSALKMKFMGTVSTVAEKMDIFRTTMLDGLALTEGREDGSYGVTMVCAADAGEVYTLRDTGGATDAAYLAGDVATDPFSLTVDEATTLKAEMRTLMASDAITASADGTIKVLSRQNRPSGATVLQVVVEVTTTTVGYRQTEGPITQNRRESVRLALVRRGDAQSGTVVVDDSAFDEASPAIEARWDGTPQTASVAMVQTAAGEYIAKQVLSMMSYEYTAQPAGSSGDLRRELLTMDALDGAPAATSSLGTAADNTLVALADATADSAFLARARRRLFPQLAVAGVPTVKAVHDWVMFRRLRPAFCEPVCVRPEPPAVKAFQVWHLQVANKEELQALDDAYANGDSLAEFKFRQVGILHYRDKNAMPEESPTQVRAMWNNARPGPQVARAGVWETAPTPGNGSQNLSRVGSMLKQIEGLTTPPASRNDIAVLPQAPRPLADNALDGGIVVVTVGKVGKVVPHRVIMIPSGDDIISIFQNEADMGWNRLRERMKMQPGQYQDILVKFVDGRLPEADASAIREADMLMRREGNAPINFLNAIRIDAAHIDAGVDPASQHAAVLALLRESFAAEDRLTDSGISTLSLTDLGNGAEVISLVSYIPAPP